MKEFFIIILLIVLPITIWAAKRKTPEQRIQEHFGKVEKIEEIAQTPGHKLFPESPDLRADRYFKVTTPSGEFFVRNGAFGLDTKPAK